MNATIILEVFRDLPTILFRTYDVSNILTIPLQTDDSSTRHLTIHAFLTLTYLGSLFKSNKLVAAYVNATRHCCTTFMSPHF